jgi:hypothetical protein
MKEALDRHLADIVQEQTTGAPRRRLSTLLGLAGVATTPRTREDIDQHIRWLRDNG